MLGVLALQCTDRYLTRMMGDEKHIRPLLKADGLFSLPQGVTDVPKKKDW